MNNVWSADKIISHVKRIFDGSNYEFVLTFDDGGVSGHLNHCSISKALTKTDFTVKRLKTVPVLLKYSGIIGFILVSIFANNYESVSLLDAYKYGYCAMLEHKTQLVWFRRLYLIFSLYMTINILE